MEYIMIVQQTLESQGKPDSLPGNLIWCQKGNHYVNENFKNCVIDFTQITLRYQQTQNHITNNQLGKVDNY